MKVAWFSPLPPDRSGVAEYSSELLPFLDQYMNIELFVDDIEKYKDSELADRFPIFHFMEHRKRNRPTQYDLNVYHMGNSLAHRFVYLSLVETPGLVILHEPMLHHFMLQMLSAGWTLSDYSRELDYNYGVKREPIEEIVLGDGTELSRFNYPLLQRVVDSSLGIIVHSEYARREVMRHHPPCSVSVVKMPYVAPETGSATPKEQSRKILGLPDESFIFGTFGFVTPAKRIETILNAFKEFSTGKPEALLVITGGQIPEFPLERLIEERGLGGKVIAPGYVELDKLLMYMSACDLTLSLRYPSAGETPASALRLLGLGCPTVLSDYKAFSEFPDDVCIKVNPKCDAKELLEVFDSAYSDREMLERTGARAMEYAAREHDPDKSAAGYLEFANRIVQGELKYEAGAVRKAGADDIRDDLTSDIAEIMCKMNVGPANFSIIHDIASDIDSIFPGSDGS